LEQASCYLVDPINRAISISLAIPLISLKTGLFFHFVCNGTHFWPEEKVASV
jgi:hypothetical protein